MEGRVHGTPDRPAAFVTDLLAAARYAEGLGHDRPVVLAYFPPVPLNPYQALLYRRTLSTGIAAVPMARLDHLETLTNVTPGLVANGVTVALHLHWLNRITRSATDEADAAVEVQAFLARLDAFLAAGGRLVWTAHNVLPHDSRYPAADTVLRQGLADRAALVHVVAGGTAEAIGDRYTLPPPDRVVHVPHPSYRGAYPEGPARDQARLSLGLTPDELVYAFVGAIRPYKGLAALLAAFDEVSADGRPRRLLVAGNPDKSAAVEAAIDAALAHPNVLLSTGLLPAEEIATVLRAADVAVLPYRDALNSGVLMLALTFGLPVVAPAIPGVLELVDARVAATFQPGEPGALADALRRADQLPGDAATARALEIAAAHDPDTLSDRFATALRRALEAR
jgi:beta-1,4-mannosyltransferase